MEKNSFFPGQRRVIILPNHRLREGERDLINNHKNVPPPRLLPDPSHPALINYKVDYPGSRIQIAETRPSHMQNNRQAELSHPRGKETPSILFGENNFSAPRFQSTKYTNNKFQRRNLTKSGKMSDMKPAAMSQIPNNVQSSSNQDYAKYQTRPITNKVTLAPYITTSWSLNLHHPSTTSISMQNKNALTYENQYPQEEYINERIGLAYPNRAYDSHRPLVRSSTNKLIPSPVNGMNGSLNNRFAPEVSEWSEPPINSFKKTNAEYEHQNFNIRDKFNNVNELAAKDTNIRSSYNNQFHKQQHFSNSHSYDGPYLTSHNDVNQRGADLESHEYDNNNYYNESLNNLGNENHQMNKNNQGSKVQDKRITLENINYSKTTNEDKNDTMDVDERMNEFNRLLPETKQGSIRITSIDRQYQRNSDHNNFSNTVLSSSRPDNDARNKKKSNYINDNIQQSSFQTHPNIRKSFPNDRKVNEHREQELRSNEPLRRGIVQDMPQYRHQENEDEIFDFSTGEVIDFPNKFQRPNSYSTRDGDSKRHQTNFRPKLVSSFVDESSKKAETQSTIYQSESNQEASFKATTADHWYLMPVQGWFALSIILAAILLVILVVFYILYQSWKRQKTKIANFISPNDVFLGGCIDPIHHELCSCRGLSSFVRANQFHERASVMSRLSKHQASSIPQRAATIGFERSSRLVDDLRCLPTWKGGLELKDEDIDSITTQQTQMCGTPPPPPLAPKISIGKMSDNLRNFREIEENSNNLNRTLSLSKGLDKSKNLVTHFDRNDGFRKSFASSRFDTYQEVGKVSEKMDINIKEPRRTVSSNPKLNFTSEKFIQRPLNKKVLPDDGDVKLTTIYPPPLRFDMQHPK